jgi:hypothetical protein
MSRAVSLSNDKRTISKAPCGGAGVVCVLANS